MPANYQKWGDWNALCDRCGFKFKASQMTKEWDNLMVCKACWEERHPQDFLRVRGDDPSVPWSRPEPDDIFVGPACFLWDQSGFAGLAVAGCAQAGKDTPLNSIQLYNLKFPPSPA